MNETLSISPSEKILSRLETLIEQLYDLVQALRDDEESQAWFWTAEVQAEIKKSEKDLKQGNFAAFDTSDEMIAHFDSLSERANAQSQKYKTI
jgi:hypothetical protein